MESSLAPSPTIVYVHLLKVCALQQFNIGADATFRLSHCYSTGRIYIIFSISRRLSATIQCEPPFFLLYTSTSAEWTNVCSWAADGSCVVIKIMDIYSPRAHKSSSLAATVKLFAENAKCWNGGCDHSTTMSIVNATETICWLCGRMFLFTANSVDIIHVSVHLHQKSQCFFLSRWRIECPEWSHISVCNSQWKEVKRMHICIDSRRKPNPVGRAIEFVGKTKRRHDGGCVKGVEMKNVEWWGYDKNGLASN